jgi:pyruvate/2-oxoglutarate dehydrogenase complex dihydrolipoamide acyltransferase (E2) component
MRKAIVMPDVGVASAQVSAWYVHPGELVYAGDRVVELLMGAATFEVLAPCAGRFVEKAALLQDCVAVGQVLGYIEEEPLA